MDVFTWCSNYAEAEDAACRYKGDTGTEERVRVVQDFEADRFLVVIGEVDDDDRYEVQHEA
jgi:hypothetical protein